jgi:hypothetical protein
MNKTSQQLLLPPPSTKQQSAIAVCALMDRSVHHRLLGGNLKTRLEIHCRPVKQDEAAAKLGCGLRSFDAENLALFPFLYFGLPAGVLSITTAVHSVPCGWIKLCVRTAVDVWLLCVCEIELLLGRE